MWCGGGWRGRGLDGGQSILGSLTKSTFLLNNTHEVGELALEGGQIGVGGIPSVSCLLIHSKTVQGGSQCGR
jgi:hypothetical protein